MKDAELFCIDHIRVVKGRHEFRLWQDREINK